MAHAPPHRALLLATGLVLLARGGAAHPLDPLSADEIAATVSVLRAADLIDAKTRLPLIDLAEPPKASVLAWEPGQPERRAAAIVARRDRTVYEGAVDLATRSVADWRAIPNVQSSVLAEEEAVAQRVTLADPLWRAAMRQRGYDRFDHFFCAPFTAGPGADPAERGRRLLKMVCYDTAGSRNNVWSRPIEGVYSVVDLDQGKVIRVVDDGVVPVSPDPADYGEAAESVGATAVAPSRDVAVDGNEVRWHRWRFHFRLDRRAGPIVSLVRYDDGERKRLVLYRGSIAELFVPYMDPDGGWSFRNFLDVGEHGFGGQASPLRPGADCPLDARFIDATLADDSGEPVTLKSRLCLFERNTAAPLWRHAEFANRTYRGQRGVELVLRTIASLGNYDYIVDWVFDTAGIIRIDVGATGSDAVKGVAAQTMADPSAARDTQYGTLVAPNLTAVNHDHFLSLRLDVDIDGQANTLVRRRPVPQRTGDGGGRSLWRVVDEDVTEEGAPSDQAHGVDAMWRIVNPNLTNRLGQHPGYELRGGHTATALVADGDVPPRRAEFAAAPLWVTAYDPRQFYAAGDYPNQSSGGDGLPAYAARHRAVVNVDIVLWCTIGFHHVPRPEDWPVMTTVWHSVALVPAGFFDHNPALDPPLGDRAR
jgi:primary-amine oxidase